MVPMRHSTIFKNRWFALLWAAGIIWFAIDTAGVPDGTDENGTNAAVVDATGAPVDDQQLQALESAVKGI